MKLPKRWTLLVVLAAYDICAVLSPCGPLKALVEMSQERQEPIPGLVYEATIEEDDAPMQLGLGDLGNRSEPTPVTALLTTAQRLHLALAPMQAHVVPLVSEAGGAAQDATDTLEQTAAAQVAAAARALSDAMRLVEGL